MVEKIRVEGLRETQRALHKLPKATAKNILRRILMKRGKPIAEAAKERVPVDEGVLKESIAVSPKLSYRQRKKHRKAHPDDVEVFVGAGRNPQAHLQEFGTSKAPAQPFLRPAWDANKNGVLKGIKDDLWMEIKKAAARLARKAARIAAKGGK